MTVNATLCCPLSFNGNVAPLIENSLPKICMAVMVTAQCRAFVRTRGRLELPPTGTWPNDRVDGEAVTAWLSTPLPPVCTLTVELGPLPENLIIPPVQPVVVGVKLMLTSTLWPAGTTSGKARLGVANAASVTETSDNVTLVNPPFVTVTRRFSV